MRAALSPKSFRGYIGPLLLGLLVLFPASLEFLIGASFSVGTIITAMFSVMLFLIGLITYRSYDRSNEILIPFGLIGLILVHLLVAYLINPVFPTKGLSSLPLLAAILLAVPVVRDSIFIDGAAHIDRGARIVAAMLLLAGVFSTLGLQPPSPTAGAKPCFPFTEPSFLAFCGAPIIVYVCVTSKGWARLAWLGAFLAITATLANLTLLAACMIAALCSLRIPLMIVVGIASFLVSNYVDLAYYQERIELTVSSNNLSALVYVQGWQLLEESLRNTNGWGLGFQQLGQVYTNVFASYRLVYLLGRDSNLADGGFLLAKAGSEFGIFVLPLVGFAAYSAARAALRLRAAALGKAQLSRAHILASASIVAFMIETFVRGTSYFSGTVLLMLASFAYLWLEARSPAVRGEDPNQG